MNARFTVEGRIGIVALTRPERLNAISASLLDDLLAAFDAASDADVDAIVFEGEGRAFSAGDDLQEFLSGPHDAASARHFVERLQEVTRRIMYCRLPVVCAVQGYAIGAAASWPLNADFAVVADDAVLFCPEAEYGLFPSGGATILLAERCGPARAADVLWRGTRICGLEWKSLGLATDVVRADEVGATARRLASELATQSALTTSELKVARRIDIGERLERALLHELEQCVAASLSPAVRHRIAAERGIEAN